MLQWIFQRDANYLMQNSLPIVINSHWEPSLPNAPGKNKLWEEASRLPVISPPGSFATNQLATKIFILSMNTEVDNKRATLKVHVFFSRIVFKIAQVALLFCDFLVMNVQ